MRYKYRNGQSCGIPAQVAGERIEEIRNTNGGRVSAQQIVEDARADGSPLHGAFEWDDGVAAEKFRVEQARRLIRTLVTITEPTGEPTEPRQAYVSIGAPRVGSAYVQSYTAMSDAEMRDKVIADAIKALSGLKARFGHLEELAAIWPVIEALRPTG